LLRELLYFFHHGPDFRMYMWSETASGNLGRVCRELPIFLPPFIDAAIQQRCVVAVA
jgi:hypothetical protein